MQTCKCLARFLKPTVLWVCGPHKIRNRKNTCRQTYSLTSLWLAWRPGGGSKGWSRSGANQSQIGSRTAKSGNCGFQGKQPPSKLSLKPTFCWVGEPDFKRYLLSHRLQMVIVAHWSKTTRATEKLTLKQENNSQHRKTWVIGLIFGFRSRKFNFKPIFLVILRLRPKPAAQKKHEL